ncbi:MAG: PKD domain-containing protein [Thermoplasmatales archaeon]|nr:PKD domain-containing protein [Thermoplasmatales archaeon]
MKYDSVRLSLIFLLVIFLVSSTVPAFDGSYFLEENSSAYEEVVKTGCILPLLSPPVTIDKKVRINPDDPWQNSITSPICSDLEFKISVHNTKITPKNVVVTDFLPTILNYVSGSANPEPDGYTNDTEEVIVWIMNIPAWTTKTITYHADLVAPGYGENYVHVVTFLPPPDPDDDIVPITGINNPPNSPSTPDPSDGATDIDVDADLSWTGGDPDTCDTVTYDVYFEAGDETPDELVSEGQSDNTYDPGTMDPNTVYYWQIVAWDSHGASTSGPIWSFETESGPPNDPSTPSGPMSGDVGVSYTYSTSASDPEGDQVYYWFDWDDSTNSGWVGPYNSGQTGSASYSWSSPGTYYIKAKAKDVHDAESGWSPTLTVTIDLPNDPPTAYIDLIDPYPEAEEGEPVTFTGHGEDSDGYIIGYNWRSSIDEQLSTQASFTTSSLTPGTHTIYFKVKDNDNDWSPEVTDTLVIIGNEPPTAYIDSIDPYPEAEEGEPVTFIGHGEDSDGYIVGYNWRSSIDGDLSTEASFTTSTLRLGTHTIYFKVKDDGDKWSYEVYDTLEIIPSSGDPPEKPVIDGPTYGVPGTEYEYILNAVDPDGDDVRYHIDWGDGYSTTTSYYPSGNNVQVSHIWNTRGIYIIKVKAEDTNDAYSNETTLPVNMPRDRAVTSLLFQKLLERLEGILERFPNAFPLLRRIFGLQ